jgi:uncharacterized protein (DUF2164 family)
LVYEIYQATARMKAQLSSEQLLLITQWVNFYNRVSEPVLEQIKPEVHMEFVETTISEHIYNQGKAEGKAEGILEGQLAALEIL